MAFHKYHKIKGLGHIDTKDMTHNPEDDVLRQEKIDGANFRFMPYYERIIFGSRNCSLGDDTQDIGGNWKRAVEFVKEKLKGKKSKKHYIF